MTFNQVWDQLVGKRASLSNPKSVVEFESGNLKKLLEQVYEKGRDAGTRVKASAPLARFPFGNIFG